MWGSCFWFCIPSASVRRLPPPHTQLVHTHTQLVHSQLAHTQLVHTQLTLHTTYSTHNLLTHNLFTHNLITHNLLTHTTCTHTHTTYSHTQLVHTQLTHTHTTYSHTTYSHTTCSHTTQLTHTQLVHTQLVHTQLTHTQLTHTQLVHTQLVHTQLVTLRGRRGTYGTGLALVARLVPRRRCDAAAFCVAGVALCDIHLHFVWQAWHFTTWIVTLRGRRGTYGTGLALVARLVPRRRCDAAAFCVAGVALCDIHLHFVWQAWRLMTWIVTLRGRRGTYGTGLALVARLVPRRRCDAAAFCVAGVALCDIHLHFVWQAWRLTTSIVTLRGRRGTYGAGPLWWRAWSAGGAVTLRRFAWQAWHCVTSTFTLCGRRGT